MTQQPENSNTVIRIERDGIEYFTIVATGECAMSERGLAIACGVYHGTIQNLVKNLANKAPSKRLESFVGKVLDLATDATKKGGKIKAYRADFCAAVITHYAFKGSEVAQDFLSATSTIGLTSYIQGVTGWLPEAHQSSKESRTALDRILNAPTTYQVLYDPVLYDKAVGFVGVGFYWRYCYDFLTPTERCKLNAVNAITPDGRVNYIHQHINPETRKKLEFYLARLGVVVNLAETKQDFEAYYQQQFYGNKQLKLDLNEG